MKTKNAKQDRGADAQAAAPYRAPQDRDLPFVEPLETALHPYSHEELLDHRDELGELLRKTAPQDDAAKVGPLLKTLMRSAAREEDAAFGDLLKLIPRAHHKRLRALKTLSRYIRIRELAASPGSRDLPPPPANSAPPPESTPLLPQLLSSEPQPKP